MQAIEVHERRSHHGERAIMRTALAVGQTVVAREDAAVERHLQADLLADRDVA